MRASAPVGAAAVRLDEAGGERFAAQRRTTTPLEAGAAVVTGAGDLAAGFVVHVVIADERGPAPTGEDSPRAGVGLAAGRRLGAAAHCGPAGGRRERPAHGGGVGRASGRDISERAPRGASSGSSYTRRNGAWSKPSYGGRRRDPVAGTDETVRQVHRRGRHRSRGAPRGAVRPAGSERRRQDHVHPDDRRHPPAHERDGGRGRRGHPGATRSRPRPGSATSPTGRSSTTS